MYHHTTRLLTILELLQSRARIGGPELAERLEVDVRTIRRGIAQLQDMGIPIVSEPGRGGGYALRPGYRLPPLMLNDGEAAAVSLGLLVAARLGVDGSALAVAGAQAKLLRALPAALREAALALASSVSIDLPRATERIDGATLLTLARAADQGRAARFSYARRDGEAARRTVDIYGVAALAGRWYAVGRCHERRAQRIFRLDRVSQPELTELRFERPAGFDAREAIVARVAAIPDRWDFVVRVEATADVVRRHIPETLAVLEVAGDATIVRGSIDDLDWLARQLVAVGRAIAVETPPELRLAFVRLADTLRRVGEW